MASFVPRSNSPAGFAGLAAQTRDAIDLMMADRILATALHYFGDQREARHHIDRALAQLAALAQQPQIVRVRFDMRVSTHYFQARILWLQGFPEQALRVVEHNIGEGNAVGQALSFCSVLGQGACPIAFWAGDLDAAERYGAMLFDHTERHPIRLWHVWARCFNGLVIAKRGDLGAGLRALRGGLEEAGEARFLPRFLLLLGELAACLGKAGEIGLGLETVDEALARCEARDERWYVAELLRIKGELVILEDAADAATSAEGLFLRALAGSRRALGSCGRRRASHGFGEIGIAPRRRASCWDRFTAASLKASRPQTCNRRKTCGRNWRNPGAARGLRLVGRGNRPL